MSQEEIDIHSQRVVMPSRREFVKHTVVAAVTALTPISIVHPENSRGKPKPSAGAHIKSVVMREDTVVRHGGNGDIFPLTWTSSDRQFCSFSDGYGWATVPKEYYNTRALWIDGDPVKASIHETDAYPNPIPKEVGKYPPYYGFGALAVDERIYQLMCCMGKSKPWNGVKLIYSADQGRSWRNQEGSTPVAWQSYAAQSHENMLFVDEPQDAFSLISFLQMGKNYEANRDGYVYGYAPNGNTDGTMNQLVMFRVIKRRVLDRSAYEFFGGMKSMGSATWVKDIGSRSVVHTFPRGWVNDKRRIPCLVQSWLPSVVYNPALDTYLMAASGVGVSPDGEWNKPSYLGFWLASNPWGPWTQIYETKAWTPGNDSAARNYSPQIAPKWMALDGKSFWLVWSDFQGVMEQGKELERRKEELDALSSSEQMRTRAEIFRRHAPYYSFNVQRVDLIVS